MGEEKPHIPGGGNGSGDAADFYREGEDGKVGPGWGLIAGGEAESEPAPASGRRVGRQEGSWDCGILGSWGCGILGRMGS